MAVQTEAKTFLSSHIVQSIINDIYTGRIVFSSTGSRSVLADNYKPRAIEIYDVSKAPLLNHYRLRVPKYGAILDFLSSVTLLVIFVFCITCEPLSPFCIRTTEVECQSDQNLDHLTPWEIIFIVYAAAFTLGEYTAANEHGWSSKHLFLHLPARTTINDSRYPQFTLPMWAILHFSCSHLLTIGYVDMECLRRIVRHYLPCVYWTQGSRTSSS